MQEKTPFSYMRKDRHTELHRSFNITLSKIEKSEQISNDLEEMLSHYKQKKQIIKELSSKNNDGNSLNTSQKYSLSLSYHKSCSDSYLKNILDTNINSKNSSNLNNTSDSDNISAGYSSGSRIHYENSNTENSDNDISILKDYTDRQISQYYIYSDEDISVESKKRNTDHVTLSSKSVANTINNNSFDSSVTLSTDEKQINQNDNNTSRKKTYKKTKSKNSQKEVMIDKFKNLAKLEPLERQKKRKAKGFNDNCGKSSVVEEPKKKNTSEFVEIEGSPSKPTQTRKIRHLNMHVNIKKPIRKEKSKSTKKANFIHTHLNIKNSLDRTSHSNERTNKDNVVMLHIATKSSSKKDVTNDEELPKLKAGPSLNSETKGKTSITPKSSRKSVNMLNDIRKISDDSKQTVLHDENIETIHKIKTEISEKEENKVQHKSGKISSSQLERKYSKIITPKSERKELLQANDVDFKKSLDNQEEIINKNTKTTVSKIKSKTSLKSINKKSNSTERKSKVSSVENTKKVIPKDGKLFSRVTQDTDTIWSKTEPSTQQKKSSVDSDGKPVRKSNSINGLNKSDVRDKKAPVDEVEVDSCLFYKRTSPTDAKSIISFSEKSLKTYYCKRTKKEANDSDRRTPKQSSISTHAKSRKYSSEISKKSTDCKILKSISTSKIQTPISMELKDRKSPSKISKKTSVSNRAEKVGSGSERKSDSKVNSKPVDSNDESRKQMKKSSKNFPSKMSKEKPSVGSTTAQESSKLKLKSKDSEKVNTSKEEYGEEVKPSKPQIGKPASDITNDSDLPANRVTGKTKYLERPEGRDILSNAVSSIKPVKTLRKRKKVTSSYNHKVRAMRNKRNLLPSKRKPRYITLKCPRQYTTGQFKSRRPGGVHFFKFSFWKDEDIDYIFRNSGMIPADANKSVAQHIMREHGPLTEYDRLVKELKTGITAFTPNKQVIHAPHLDKVKFESQGPCRIDMPCNRNRWDCCLRNPLNDKEHTFVY